MPRLHGMHSSPRTFPVAWSWSTASRGRTGRPCFRPAPGLVSPGGLRQIAQRPPCAASRPSYSSSVIPYCLRRWASRTLSGCRSLQAIAVFDSHGLHLVLRTGIAFPCRATPNAEGGFISPHVPHFLVSIRGPPLLDHQQADEFAVLGEQRFERVAAELSQRAQNEAGVFQLDGLGDNGSIGSDASGNVSPEVELSSKGAEMP